LTERCVDPYSAAQVTGTDEPTVWIGFAEDVLVCTEGRKEAKKEGRKEGRKERAVV
jgi:hypothetical protein